MSLRVEDQLKRQMRARPKPGWKYLKALALGAPLLALPVHAQPSFVGWQVVTVNADTPSKLQALAAIPHEDMFGHGGVPGPNIVLVSPSSVQALQAQGLSFQVEVSNYQAYLDFIAAQRVKYGNVPASTPAIVMADPFTGVRTGNIGVITQALDEPPPIENAWYWTYHTHDEVIDKLNALRDRYASATNLDLEITSLGQTAEGREIPTLRITGPVKEGQRPALYLRSGIHAAEQVGVLSSMYMVETMLSDYARGNSRMVELLKNVELYFTPLQNPDGYHHFRQTGDLDIRKNRADYQSTLGVCPLADDQGVGVELNRNWDTRDAVTGVSNWCIGDTGTISTDHCARAYCGPSAGSELEVQAMVEFMKRTRNLAGNIDIHSYSQLVLIPWAYNPAADKPHDAVYRQLQTDIIAEIKKPNGAVYDRNISYKMGGGSTDWTQQQGLWSLAYETRPLLTGGSFQPQNDETMPTVVLTGKEILRGTLFFAEFLVQDLDRDGVVNGFDNCPDVQNFTQRDCDGNHIGDVCDKITPKCTSDAVIVLDESGSMKEKDGFSGATRGAHALSGFGAYLYNSFFTPGTSRAAMVSFAASPRCLAYPNSGGTSCNFVDIKKRALTPTQDAPTIDTSFALDALTKAEASYSVKGKTDILEAVEFAVNNFSNAPKGVTADHQYLYLLSDGEQTEPFSQTRYDRLIRDIRDNHENLTISALAVTPEADMDALLSYTAPTNGAIGYAEEANGVPVYWHEVIAENIREIAVVAGPDKITTPRDIIVQEASVNGVLDFTISQDATAFTVVLASRGATWGLAASLTDRLGNRFSTTSHPQLFSKPSFDDSLLIAHIPNPVSGKWTLVTNAGVNQSSNFIVTEYNPTASVGLEGSTRVIHTGEAAKLTPVIEYRGVPLDVNTANCSVFKATVPGGRTLYAADLPAAAITLSNTQARIIAGLPPTIQVTPFAGRGYYTVQVRCNVTSSARAVPGTQLNGTVNAFTHNASFTIFADVPQMPACTTTDCDRDGIPNAQEGSGDSDGDGWLDGFDTDSDNDDVPDSSDTCRLVPNPEQQPFLPGVTLTATNMTVSSCLPQSLNVSLTRPTIKVGCVNPSSVTLTAALVSVDGRALSTPLTIDPTNVALPVGTSIVRWTGTDPAGNTGTVQQTIVVTQSETAAACCAGKTVIQGSNWPDIMLRPLGGQYCMLAQGSIDTLVGGPDPDNMFGGEGLDSITSGGVGSLVSGGTGPDVLTSLAGSTYGGADSDIIEMTGGGVLYGNEGDDDIVSIVGDHRIYPGPGRDFVHAGLGNDHVYVYDACELSLLEVLDGGLGNDTLHIPMPLLDVLARGVIVLNFESIVVETNNRHLSECF